MDGLESGERAARSYNTTILREQLVDRQSAVDDDTRGLFSPKPFALKQLKSYMMEQVSCSCMHTPGWPITAKTFLFLFDIYSVKLYIYTKYIYIYIYIHVGTGVYI